MSAPTQLLHDGGVVRILGLGDLLSMIPENAFIVGGATFRVRVSSLYYGMICYETFSVRFVPLT